MCLLAPMDYTSFPRAASARRICIGLREGSLYSSDHVDLVFSAEFLGVYASDYFPEIMGDQYYKDFEPPEPIKVIGNLEVGELCENPCPVLKTASCMMSGPLTEFSVTCLGVGHAGGGGNRTRGNRGLCIERNPALPRLKYAASDPAFNQGWSVYVRPSLRLILRFVHPDLSVRTDRGWRCCCWLWRVGSQYWGSWCWVLVLSTSSKMMIL